MNRRYLLLLVVATLVVAVPASHAGAGAAESCTTSEHTLTGVQPKRATTDVTHKLRRSAIERGPCMIGGVLPSGAVGAPGPESFLVGLDRATSCAHLPGAAHEIRGPPTVP